METPSCASASRKRCDAWIAFLQAIVKEGIERGTCARMADSKTVAALIVASLEGALDDEPYRTQPRFAPPRPGTS